MVEITTSDVRSIYDTQLDDSALQVWVDAATSFLEKAITQQQPGDFATGDRETVAKLLAAHFAAASDPTADGQTIGDNSFQYESPDEIGDGLRETRFGRRAITLGSVHGLDLQAVSVQSAEFRSIGLDNDRPRSW